MDSKLRQHLETYAAFHRNPVNQRIHKIAVPIIMFTFEAIPDWLKLFSIGDFNVTLGHIGYLIVIGWYLSLSIPLGLILAVPMALYFPLARVTPPWLVIAICILAWTAQFIGHYKWGKKAPALFTNLTTGVLTAPLFVVSSWLGLWPPKTNP